MTQQVSFPSTTFPAYPALSLSVPDDWEPLHLAGVPLAVGGPLKPGEFRPNVVTAITRFSAGYELTTAINAVSEKFAGLEQAHEIGRDQTTINGREWFHIESSFIDPRAGTLVQAVHLTLVANGPVVDLVQVTGSVTGAQAHDGVLDTIRAIQRSIVVATP
jgi:hypothetical protein